MAPVVAAAAEVSTAESTRADRKESQRSAVLVDAAPVLIWQLSGAIAAGSMSKSSGEPSVGMPDHLLGDGGSQSADSGSQSADGGSQSADGYSQSADGYSLRLGESREVWRDCLARRKMATHAPARAITGRRTWSRYTHKVAGALEPQPIPAGHRRHVVHLELPIGRVARAHLRGHPAMIMQQPRSQCLASFPQRQ